MLVVDFVVCVEFVLVIVLVGLVFVKGFVVMGLVLIVNVKFGMFGDYLLLVIDVYVIVYFDVYV